MRVFLPILALWVIGFGIENMCYKTALKLCEKSPLSEKEENIDLIDANSVHKHFKISFILYSITIIASLIIPITEIRWVLFFACAMVLCPTFYDVFYVLGKTIFKSKTRFIIAIPAVYNFILSAIMLFFHYFAYMHVDFSQL